ncbi:MAG: PEP-utilizing enzyme [Candidatus Parcubacteria bacterium]|nr:PEP-utilizing enzyme [Candidatus Parcubacteria bacterium]
MIIDKLQKYSKSQELMKQEGAFSLLAAYGFCSLCLFGPKWYELYPKDYNFFLGVFDKANGLYVFDWGKYKETTDIEYRRMIKNGADYLVKTLPLFDEHTRQMDELYSQNNPEQIKKLGKKELRLLFYQATEFTSVLLRDTLFSEALDQQMSKKYYLEAGGKEEEFEEFFSLASLLTFDSFKVRWDKILLAVVKKVNIDYYNLHWMYTDYFSGKSLTEIEKLVKKFDIDKAIKEIEINDKFVLENKQKQDNYLRNLPENLKALAYFILATMQTRDIRKDTFAKGMTIAYNCAWEYFNRIGLEPADCIFSYYTDYLDNILENSNYSDLIQARKKGCAVIAEPGNPVKYTWEFGDYQGLRNTFLDIVEVSNSKTGSIDQIEGQIANSGFVRGKVKIILNLADFSKFNQGDILVSSMTRPEFVPVIKKASAIVTDEGGITCHAAIVSRELNIPCIIGTKNATRNLKDGDVVEVDADKGVIKKLN